jgi:DNA-binding IclR family transcriptional regulator
MSRSVTKALQIIEQLAEADDGLALSELSDQTGYPPSTVHRLLSTLAERDYVEQEPQTKRYYLGLKIVTLQTRAIRQHHLTQLAFPHLNRLKQQVDGTVNLGVLNGKDVVYLETFVPDSILAFYSPPGTRMPACCTAMGKVLLAHLPAPAQEGILSSTQVRTRTPHTITSADQLSAELDRVVARGYAVDDQEYALGVRCIAAPIRDHSGTVVAGVSVTLPAEQLPDDKIDPTAVRVVEACHDISQALGYRGSK